MKFILTILTMLAISITNVQAQKYFTKSGEISFKSHAPLEDIEANSTSASSVIDQETGKIQWAVLIKSFEFEKALMHEHFNENYMESTKFPKATYSGTIENIADIDFSKEGKYTAYILGKLTIHGVTKQVNSTAEITVVPGRVLATCKLKIVVADFEIEIPSVVKENIANEVKVAIKANYEVFSKT